MGDVHKQTADIFALSQGETIARPEKSLVSREGQTPNQRYNAMVLAYAWAEKFGTAQEKADGRAGLDWFWDLDRKFGHQADGIGGPRVETLAPMPHGALHCIPAAGLLELMPNDPRIIAWWAVHVMLHRIFDTPAGMRAPSDRAKGAGDWSCDDACVALIEGRDTGRAAKSHDPMLLWPLAMLGRARSAFPAILKLAETIQPMLQVPIRFWRLPGGAFAAALVHTLKDMVEPRGALIVDAAGTIVQQWVLIDPLPPELAELGEPTQVIGGRGAVVEMPVQPVPQVPPSQGGHGPELRAISDEIAAWPATLPKKPTFDWARELAAKLYGELKDGAPARPLSEIAADVDRFGRWANPVAARLRGLA